MKRTPRTALFVAVALLTVAAGVVAREPDPAQVVPADALLYVEMTGPEVAEALGALALPPVAKLAVPRLESRFGHLERVLDMPPGVVAEAVPRIRAAAVAMLGRQPMFVLGFGDPTVVEGILAKGAENPDGTVSLGKATLARRGPFLVAADAQTAAFVAQGDFAPLSNSDRFSGLLRAEDEGPAWARLATAAGLRRDSAEGAEEGLIRAYVAVQPLLELLKSNAPAHDLAEINTLLAVSGLADAATATYRGTDAEGGPAADLALHLGDEARGMLALLPEEGLRAGRWVPHDAAAALLLNWGDASEFLGSLRDLLVEADGELGNGEAARRIQRAEQRWGITLDELFDQIGSGAALYLPSAPAGGFIGRGDITFVLALEEPGAFQQSLDSILTAMTGSPAVEEDFEGLNIRRIGPFPVYYFVSSNLMMAAGSPAALKRHVAWATASRAATLEPRVTDQAALLRLDLGYLLQSFPRTEPGPKATVAVSRDGDEVRMAFRTQDWDVAGIRRAYTAAWVGMMATRLMPALKGARAEAAKADARSDLHEIGLGIAMYKMDHQGRFPLNLEVLLQEDYISGAEVFVDPRDTNPRRRGAMRLPYSYEYVGPIPKSAPPELIIAYARPDIEPGGRNVLYVDNAVRWVSEEELHSAGGGRGMSLPQCYEWLMEHSEGWSRGRERELRRFYGVE